MKNTSDTAPHTKKSAKKTPVKAIRKYCLECCLEKPSEVRLCAAKDCALWPYRMGKNPFHGRQMTEEQKRAATKRLNPED